MRRAIDEGDEIPGGDSFLDIVANIVGIIVLLVVVVGVRAGNELVAPQVVEIEPDVDTRMADAEGQLESLVRTVAADEREVIELRDQIESLAFQAGNREELRIAAAEYVAKFKVDLEESRNRLSERDQQSLEIYNEIAAAKRELDTLEAKQFALGATAIEEEIETIVVSPTPLVVRGDDEVVSFRLKEGRLIYVPLDEITDDLAGRLTAPRVSPSGRTTKSTISSGVHGGFVGELVRVGRMSASGGAARIESQITVTLREVTDLRGETLDEAFAPSGNIVNRLARYNPESQLIRLLIYPDSFEAASDCVQKFKDNGFRVAQSLQSDDGPLRFSTNGRRAYAQ